MTACGTAQSRAVAPSGIAASQEPDDEHADMQTVVVDDGELACRVGGGGTPVVLIHAAGLADFFAPLEDSELPHRAQ